MKRNIYIKIWEELQRELDKSFIFLHFSLTLHNSAEKASRLQLFLFKNVKLLR